jgi:hypothetical protein
MGISTAGGSIQTTDNEFDRKALPGVTPTALGGRRPPTRSEARPDRPRSHPRISAFKPVPG